MELEVVDRGQFFGFDSFQIRSKIETIGQVRSLFGEIDNQYTSYVRAEDAVPHRVVNSISQGQQRIDQTVIFDHNGNQAIFSDDVTLPIPAGTYDLPSMIYGLRLKGMSIGSKAGFTAIFGKDLIEIEAEAQSRERVATQNGTYDTIRIKLSPKKKLSKYRVLVWLTDDDKRLPVQIKASLPFGETRAQLASATLTVRQGIPVAGIGSLKDESGAFLPGPKGGTGELNGKHPGMKSLLALPFRVGERLNYEVAWGNFTNVGRATFEVRQQGLLGNQRVFELYGEASTLGAARTLINVGDQISSYVQVDTLAPLRTDIRLREGRRSKQDSALYNWSTKTATLLNGTQIQLQPGTLDLISLFYSIRASELKLGATYNFPFIDANCRPQMVTVRPVKHESITGPLGIRNTIQIDILTPAPTQTLIAQAWISNDPLRLPLYIVTRTRFGELQFQLTSITAAGGR